MPINWWMFLVAGLIPLAVGFFWYGNMMFGKKWMAVNQFTEEKLKEGNMAVIFGLSYLFSIMVALTLSGIAIHQGAVYQMMMPEVAEPGSAAAQQFNDLMEQYGGNFRSFKHGVIHGVFFTLFFILPLIGINALFERRGWTYIWIHTGYWLVCTSIMGGLLCASLVYAPV